MTVNSEIDKLKKTASCHFESAKVCGGEVIQKNIQVLTREPEIGGKGLKDGLQH